MLRGCGCGNGTRPPCSEVAGLLHVLVSRQQVPGCVGKEGRPGVETAWEGPGREAGVGVEGVRRKGLESRIRHFSSTWLSLSLKIEAMPLLEQSARDSAGELRRLGRGGWRVDSLASVDGTCVGVGSTVFWFLSVHQLIPEHLDSRPWLQGWVKPQ